MGFPYTRTQAAYPLDYILDNKFWPMPIMLSNYRDQNFMSLFSYRSLYVNLCVLQIPPSGFRRNRFLLEYSLLAIYPSARDAPD